MLLTIKFNHVVEGFSYLHIRKQINESPLKNFVLADMLNTSVTTINSALIAFLVHHILYRRPGGHRKELNVKTHMQAIEKWFDMKPEISKHKPLEFKNKILALKIVMNQVFINNLVKLDSLVYE